MKPALIYSGSSGLNTVLDPQRLSQGTIDNPGMVELSQAVNVSIDDRGLVSLRNGDTLQQAGAFHSLFCDGGDCFVVQERIDDAAIMRVMPDCSLVGVRSGLTKNRRMAWTQANGDTFYSNGLQNGFIRAGVSSPWPTGTQSGHIVTREYASDIPKGDHLAFVPGGLMLIAEGSVLWVLDIPFEFGLLNRRSGFVQFGSAITMLCPVRAGVFVSDAERTWFLRGTTWSDYVQEQVDTAPVITGTLAPDKVQPRDMGLDLNGSGRIWCSAEGLCLGLDDGTLLRLTKEKVSYPDSQANGACLVRGTTVINTVY